MPGHARPIDEGRGDSHARPIDRRTEVTVDNIKLETILILEAISLWGFFVGFFTF